MKSYENDLLGICEAILQDASLKCSEDVNYARDYKTIVSRVKHQGLSFLTITMPNFVSDFDNALSKGRIDSSHFKSFKKCAGLPAFLQGFLSLVFEKHTRRLLNDVSIPAIEGIRQIGNAFKKIKINCTEERRKAAYKGYLQSEHVFSNGISIDDHDRFVDTAHKIWSGHWFRLDYDLVPRHGPGTTAERITLSNEKFTRKWQWPRRLERYFPSADFLLANYDQRKSSYWKRVTIQDEKDELPVRVIDVPKTLKTRRIIATEPRCMQYAQQAVAAVLIDRIESHPLTRGHINFSDQQINRELARLGSISGRMATLDESAASDRVPLDPAIRMFDSNPDLQGAILACRSTRADVKGVTIELKKFASMGSALCFPVEAMYFYTLCVMALLDFNRFPCDGYHISKVAKDIYVYGDDLIVPTEAADTVMMTLTKYYCKVNAQKSFFKGNFRESCGLDAFKGEEVTPTYVRELPPHNRHDAGACISLVETSNLFYKRGYWRTADKITKILKPILYKLPILSDTSPGLGLSSFQKSLPVGRYWNKKLHQYETKAWVAKPVKRKDPCNGQAALLKCLLRLESRKSKPVKWVGHFVKAGQVQDFCASITELDDEHLKRSVLRNAIALHRCKVGAA